MYLLSNWGVTLDCNGAAGRFRDGKTTMAKYVVLVNWTEKGVSTAKDTTDRAGKVGDLVKSVGGNMDLILWTLGRYDIVAVCDAPDDETAAR